MDDDIYPAESPFAWQTEPKEQVSARKKEKGAALAAQNEIKKVIKHFEERIQYRDTIESLNVDLKEDPLLHQKKCEVNDMLKIALEEEKQLLEELIEAHTR